MTEAPERIWAWADTDTEMTAWVQRKPTQNEMMFFSGPVAEYVRADLPAAVTVKPLVWKKIDAPTAWWRADGVGGEYAITWNWNSAGHVLTYPGKNGMERDYFGSVDEAKSAAQADYKRRILSCLTTQPDLVKDAARECLSEIVAAADQWNECNDRAAFDRLAAAIDRARALAEQEQSE